MDWYEFLIITSLFVLNSFTDRKDRDFSMGQKHSKLTSFFRTKVSSCNVLILLICLSLRHIFFHTSPFYFPFHHLPLSSRFLCLLFSCLLRSSILIFLFLSSSTPFLSRIPHPSVSQFLSPLFIPPSSFLIVIPRLFPIRFFLLSVSCLFYIPTLLTCRGREWVGAIHLPPSASMASRGSALRTFTLLTCKLWN
jgi:hypothetical protein